MNERHDNYRMMARRWGSNASVCAEPLVPLLSQPAILDGVGPGVQRMRGQPVVSVTLQRRAGICEGIHGARVPGASTPRLGAWREKDRSHGHGHTVAVRPANPL